jgi:hypothetical protein
MRGTDEPIPTYLDDHGIARVPVAYRRIRDRDERIRSLVRFLFDDARHLGRNR